MTCYGHTHHLFLVLAELSPRLHMHAFRMNLRRRCKPSLEEKTVLSSTTCTVTARCACLGLQLCHHSQQCFHSSKPRCTCHIQPALPQSHRMPTAKSAETVHKLFTKWRGSSDTPSSEKVPHTSNQSELASMSGVNSLALVQIYLAASQKFSCKKKKAPHASSIIGFASLPHVLVT